MTRSLSWRALLCCLVAPVIFAACGDDPEIKTDGPAADVSVADAPLADQLDEDATPDTGIDPSDGTASDTVAADATVADGGESADVVADMDSAVGGDAADGASLDVAGSGDTASADGGPVAACPGAKGCGCKVDAECNSGACVLWTTGSRQCGTPCKSTGDCQSGQICSNGDNAVCVPAAIALCQPCVGDNECQVGAPDGVCIDGGAAGSFCGVSCSTDSDCPTGSKTVCKESKSLSGKSVKQCVPAKGESCSCSDYAMALSAKTTCFAPGLPGCAAVRQCLPAGAPGAPKGGGLGACTPQKSAKETCDGIDNNCDGVTDEGLDTLCDDNNPCTKGSCKGGKGCEQAQASGACDDSNACTKDDGCAVGLCQGVTVTCDDKEPCTTDSCSPKTGCVHKALTGGCDDGDACTEGDSCAKAKCTGTKKDCNDGNKCTTDSCDLATGCTATASTGPCDDDDSCTTDDACTGGLCTGKKKVCDDNNPCTTDSCDAKKGCVSAFAKGACSDDDACTDKDTCINGACAGQAKDCDDDNACTSDSCDKDTGCKVSYLTDACDDGSACTEKDTCDKGACTGKGLACDDNNPCTTDSCDKVKGCASVVHEKGCDDGDGCTESDVCKGGTCAGKAKDCDDDNACTADSCSDGVCLAKALTGTTCTDGDACTSGDTCSGAGTCGGKTISCEDGNTCTDDPCDPKTGCAAKKMTTKSCDDGSKCTTSDMCDGKGKCVGAALKCDDNKPCTTDSCDPEKGCVHANNTLPCNDGDSCTGGPGGFGDICESGVCKPGKSVCSCKSDADCAKQSSNLCLGKQTCNKGKCELVSGSGVTCKDDGDSCSLESCDPKTGKCVVASAKDGTSCDKDGTVCTQGDACKSGACTAGKKRDCDDNKPCTADVCHKLAGCLHNAQAGTCTDGNACTAKDACINGSCQGALVVCNDGKACTKDSCDKQKGCVTAALTGTTCDDGSACTEKDVCTAGVCKGGAAKSCDDSNACTKDSCDPKSGCSSVALPNAVSCSDGDPCTSGDACAGGKCAVGPKKTCDDGNVCTIDACDDKSGKCSTSPAKKGAPCDDGNLCTASGCDSGKCVATSTKACTDSNKCTADGKCDPKTGACSVGQTKACDDGDKCTLDLCDPASGGCVASPIAGCSGPCLSNTDCDDGNPCTLGTCDIKTGDCSHKLSAERKVCGEGLVCGAKATCVAVSKGWARRIFSSDTAYHYCAITWNGHVACWGRNNAKQVDGSAAATISLPRYYPGLSDVTKVAVCPSHTCALTKAGEVWCWGDNYYGQSLPGKPKSVPQVLKPTKTLAFGKAKDISCGTGFTCVVGTDSKVRCVGSGTSGQLGDGLSQTSTSSTLRVVKGLSKVTKVFSAYQRTCALDGGEVWCWGRGARYTITTNSYSTVAAPVRISTPVKVATELGGGRHVNCVGNKSQFGCWGYNSEGQLGLDKKSSAQATWAAPLGVTGVLQMLGSNTVMLLDRAGRSWSAGSGNYTYGTLMRKVNDIYRFQRTEVSEVATDIATSRYVSCVLTAAGQVWCGGRNSYGELGTGKISNGSVNKSLVHGLCLNDAMCDDGLPCTKDVCDTAIARCTYAVLDKKPCDDGLPCTTDDACVASKCVGKAKVCDDQNKCTVDSCDSTSGKCLTKPAVDCDDKNNCTTDSCTAATGDCAHKVIAGCVRTCESIADCDDGSPCTTDLCTDGKCKWDASSSEGNVCVDGVCNKGQCGPPTKGWVKQLASFGAGYHYCALSHQGQVFCWGTTNSDGQLGNGTTTTSKQPVRVFGLENITSVVVGSRSSCALDKDKKVWCWGRNNYGQLGTGATSGDQTKPVAATQLSGAVQIAMGQYNTCGRFTDGTVRCVGYGFFSGSGSGEVTALKAHTVKNLTDATWVSLGNNYGCARSKSNGTVCWGHNYAKVIPGITSNVVVGATAIVGLSGPLMEVGSHNTCWKNGAGAYCVGQGNYGQLGKSTGTSSIATPVAVKLPGAVLRRSGSRYHQLMLDDTGDLYAAGYGSGRRFGTTGYTTAYWKKTTPGGPVALIAATDNASCAVRLDGVLMCTGTYLTGSGWKALQVPCTKATDCNDDSVCTTDSCTGGYCVHGAAAGSCDDGEACTTGDACSSGACVGKATTDKCDDGDICTSGDVCSGGKCTAKLAVCSDGDACTTGDTCVAVSGKTTCQATGKKACDDGNPCTADSCDPKTGQCGIKPTDNCAKKCTQASDCFDGNPCTLDVCTQAGTCSVTLSQDGLVCAEGRSCSSGLCAKPSKGWASAIASNPSAFHVCALSHGGEVYCWGRNEYGQLGDGTKTQRSVPTKVKGLTNVIQVAVGTYHTCARTSSYDVYCWGLNYYGALGTGYSGGFSSPVLTPTLAKALGKTGRLSLGKYFTCATYGGGTVYCLGVGYNGQLGDGYKKDSTTPRKAYGLTGASQLTSGGYGSCAATGSGVKCWGRNYGRALTTHSEGAIISYPWVRGGATYPSSMSLASTTFIWVRNGVAYGVGTPSPYYWQFGQAGGTTYQAKVHKLFDKDVRLVSAGNTTSVMVDKNGAIWGLGSAVYLGIGQTSGHAKIPTKAPLPVATLQVASSAVVTCALGADGQVRCAGRSYQGELGNGVLKTTAANFVMTAGPCQDKSDCNDSDVCTVDSCESGHCAFKGTTGGSCDDGDPCTPTSACAAGVCTGKVQTCSDDNACTKDDACYAKDGKAACAGTPNVVCDDKKPCTADSCDPKTGKCVFKPIAGCAIGCTTDTVCNDGNICTKPVCNLVTGGCSYKTPQNEGKSCASGKVCKSGQCLAP
ncbi:MAG: hypothetical protein KC502_04995 [Myxococcales bacterium]|nr:hypothetical protein [Myxococcales bacterium]